jgi:hypothetical protein
MQIEQGSLSLETSLGAGTYDSTTSFGFVPDALVVSASMSVVLTDSRSWLHCYAIISTRLRAVGRAGGTHYFIKVGASMNNGCPSVVGDTRVCAKVPVEMLDFCLLAFLGAGKSAATLPTLVGFALIEEIYEIGSIAVGSSVSTMLLYSKEHSNLHFSDGLLVQSNSMVALA